MGFFDVVFPVNLGPLTYRYEGDGLRPGMLVSAPLKNRLTKGIVIGSSREIPAGDIKDIHGTVGDAPLMSSSMITLMRWMSDYYIAEQGLVLKTMLPGEAFRKTRQKIRKAPSSSGFTGITGARHLKTTGGIESAALDFMKSVGQGGCYSTTLLHAPSAAFEYAFLAALFGELENTIILTPEVSLAEGLFPSIAERFGDRACLLHNELSRGSRSEALDRICSGRSDIVLGTRSSVFAPMQKVSMIAVLQEHSWSYKEEKTPYYNARDIAVMRGFTEKIPVLLSSACPSLESMHNCKKGKYALIRMESPPKTPKIKIVDMRFEKKSRPYLAKVVTDAAERHIRNNGRISFTINRRGYSTLLRCTDCEHIEECPRCRIPLVLHKKDLSLRCHYCGFTLAPVPERCGRCKSYNIKMAGAGTQRIQEDLEEILGTKAIRIDGDVSAKKSELASAVSAASGPDNRIIVGTKLMTKRLALSGGFSMAAVLNPDILLGLPDFRSPERAYQEIASVVDTLDPDGELFVQTGMPQHYLYRHLKNCDYMSFVGEENKRRKELSYPPYSKLLLIRCISEKDLSEKLSGIAEKAGDNVQVLGPYASASKSGRNEFRLLLKSSVRGSLHATARMFLDAFKNMKDVKVRVDVDPVTI